jgi:hypothetical protein
METPSRLDQARRRLRVARYGIGAAAVAGFGVFGLAARAAHPGTRTHSSSASSAVVRSEDDADSVQSFDFGDGSIGSSTGGAPAIQSGGS